jgi:hypothetical protein
MSLTRTARCPAFVIFFATLPSAHLPPYRCGYLPRDETYVCLRQATEGILVPGPLALAPLCRLNLRGKGRKETKFRFSDGRIPSRIALGLLTVSVSIRIQTVRYENLPYRGRLQLLNTFLARAPIPTDILDIHSKYAHLATTKYSEGKAQRKTRNSDLLCKFKPVGHNSITTSPRRLSSPIGLVLPPPHSPYRFNYDSIAVDTEPTFAVQ